jgi:hypothetical protein
VAARNWNALGAAQPKRYAAHFGGEAKARRAYESGASLGTARGHGRTQQARESTLSKYYRVARRVLKGEPLSQATRAEHMSGEAFRALNREARVVAKSYRAPRTPGAKRQVFDRYVSGFRPGERAHVEASFPDRDGVFHHGVPLDQKFASLVGHYLNAVDRALETGNDADLKAFAGQVVFDVHGHRYTLLTDLGALRRLHDSLTDDERADYFRLLYPRKQGRRHAA